MLGKILLWALATLYLAGSAPGGGAAAAAPVEGEARFVTLSDGAVTVSVDSYGRAGSSPFCPLGFGEGFHVGEAEDVLCEHLDYLSTGGTAILIDPIRCVESEPIMADQPNHAASTVQCGPCRVHFDQTVSAASNSWRTMVTVSGCTLSCYYSYTDYDVHDAYENEGVWRPGEGGGLGQFVVHHTQDRPEVHYLFTDGSGAARWLQLEAPAVGDFIADPEQGVCRPLPNRTTSMRGDWSAAFQYPFSLSEGPFTVSYSHGRNDGMPVP